jgi:glycosyltransferase involved in cell wall biosynthesis
MNILFIGYWGVHEGLTVSTSLPHLKILSTFEKVKKIIFTTIERDNLANTSIDIHEKVIHYPLFSGKNFVDKIKDFIIFPRKLCSIVEKYNIDYIICRGAPAGALGYLVWKKIRVPFSVESFEPHAEYMLESNVWSKYDIRFILEKYWEEKQKETAKFLMPVSINYQNQLISEGINDNKIYTIPCCVNIEKFKFNIEGRINIKEKLNISASQKVGIYVGKFGGIYYDREAFVIFKKSLEYFNGKFFLIILTSDDEKKIITKLKEVDFPIENVFVSKVEHYEVPDYLSSSDFSYSLQLPKPSNLYLCPIKNGEYWANGLPILIPEGVGDDSEIIKKEGGGVIFSLETLGESLIQLQNKYLSRKREDYNEEIRNLALKYRNFNFTKDIYELILNRL